MIGSLIANAPAWLIAVFVFLMILLFIRLGIIFRNYELRKGKDATRQGLGSLENSMLTLLGLLLAFTFGMAVTKFESRRNNIVDESNAIGTAILRCDLYPDSVRSVMRKDFQKYVEARIDSYSAETDSKKLDRALADASKYSSSIWKQVVIQAQNRENLVRSNQMVPAMNAVIDIVTKRNADRVARIPWLIMVVLLLLTLTGSFLVGYDQSSSKRSKIFILGFALMTTVTLYLIIELSRPRSGLINLNATEKYMEELRSMFEEGVQ